MSISPLSRTVAHAVSNYASQEGLTMDNLRDNASQHAGNLRAELMQTTGNTQLFTNQFVGDLLSGLSGGAPQLDAIEKAVSAVIGQHESRQQQISQSGMGDTLAASQNMGTGQRNMSNSPLMMQMANATGGANNTGNAAPNMVDSAINAGMPVGVQNPMNQSGAAVGQQGASWVSNAFKKLRTGALVLGLASAAMTGFMGYNHLTNTPDMPPPNPIELIQEQQAPSQGGIDIVTPAPVQQDGSFGPGAGQIENDKEQAHQEFLQGGASGGESSVVAPQADDAPPPPAVPNDKESAHEATYGPSSDGGGGGGSATEAPSQNAGAADEGVVTGSDEGTRSFVGGNGSGQDLGPQDTSRND